ncbi:hypothetical protein F5Y09DRAFT_349648 [Xylaria sp. FL1042]|nr:hypothetical protein F5Y09DRAFT_349648 [Xylaria sp. FL1042]
MPFKTNSLPNKSTGKPTSDPRRVQTDPAKRLKRVSISELPRLTRTTTFDVELQYAKLRLQYHRKQITASLNETRKDTIRVLKRGAALVALVSLKSCARFSDDADEKVKRLTDRFWGRDGDCYDSDDDDEW